MNASDALFRLLVFPGVLYALPAAWFMVWLYRKATARMQSRIGPPFFQPLFDFVKLLSKQPVSRSTLDGALMTALAVIAVGSTLGALALLPVVPSEAVTVGDVVLFVALLELAPLCGVVAGFVSRSLYGQIGSAREAVLGVAYSVPFMAALAAMSVAAGSLSFVQIVETTPLLVRVAALLTLGLCLPAKLRINPFSASHAEQEIYAGTMTEYDGPRLALWELAHELEWVVLVGLWAVIAAPLFGAAVLVRVAAFIGVSMVMVLVLAAVCAGTARLKVSQVVRFYWTWGVGLALFALVSSALVK